MSYLAAVRNGHLVGSAHECPDGWEVFTRRGRIASTLTEDQARALLARIPDDTIEVTDAFTAR